MVKNKKNKRKKITTVIKFNGITKLFERRRRHYNRTKKNMLRLWRTDKTYWNWLACLSSISTADCTIHHHWEDWEQKKNWNPNRKQKDSGYQKAVRMLFLVCVLFFFYSSRSCMRNCSLASQIIFKMNEIFKWLSSYVGDIGRINQRI